MIFLTTTAIDIDEELLNRCLVLTVNEDREQTQAIHREAARGADLEGPAAHEGPRASRCSCIATRSVCCSPSAVVNPYARELTFLDGQTRTRRDHMKYLTLIRSHRSAASASAARSKTVEQRGKTLEYIEVTLDDIAMANRLAHEVLGRSLDELPPQTRRLLLLIDAMVDRRVRAAADRARRTTASRGATCAAVHRLGRYAVARASAAAGGAGISAGASRRARPELRLRAAVRRQGDGGRPMLAGLIDVEKLRGQTDELRRKEAGLQGQTVAGSSGPKSAG